MTRLLAILRRLRISKKVDVVTISSRHGHFLAELTAEHKSLTISPTSFPIFLSIRFLATFIRLRKSVSKFSRYVLATLETTKAQVILATDAVKELTEIADANDHVEVVAVMHGFYVNQQGNNLREGWTREQESSVTLFALGEYDRAHYRRWGNSHQQILTVGSANNCLYLKRNHARPLLGFDICIVQGSLNPFPTDEFSKARHQNWELIADFVNRLAIARNLSIAVALSSSSKEESIRDWFENRLTQATFFRSSIDPFATYRAIDSSRVSVGEASTALVEGLARRNRCIAINFSGLDILTLPVPNLVSLINPQFEDFEKKFFDLSGMSDDAYWSAIKNDVGLLIETDEQHLTLEKIRRHLSLHCR